MLLIINQMVMLTSNQKTYKGYINRYDRERQAIFIEQDKIISMIELKRNQTSKKSYHNEVKFIS